MAKFVGLQSFSFGRNLFIVVLCSWLYCAANLFKLVFRLRELRQGFAVVGRKADDTADAAHALALKQRIGFVAKRGRVGQERGEIVGEHKWLVVIGVGFAVDAAVARAKIAIGVVRGLRCGGSFFALPLPRAFGAMR